MMLSGSLNKKQAALIIILVKLLQGSTVFVDVDTWKIVRCLGPCLGNIFRSQTTFNCFKIKLSTMCMFGIFLCELVSGNHLHPYIQSFV